MLIASYNPHEMGDVLVLMVADGHGDQTEKVQDSVVQILDEKSGQLLGYNLLNASQVLPELADVNGNVELTADQAAKINDVITKAGFDQTITANTKPHFQVGYVEKVVEHPKSDHLHIATVDFGNEKRQIVCGSVNLRENIKVVAATVGTMMPNGKLIWPGKLLGVESDGMICTPRELGLKNAPHKPGCLILDDDFAENGAAFDFDRGNQLFA
ncbi:YtpR family tRNA-binding protein [Limosilactobacillus caecicola]|uniref:YtpR family tRNA-binding protein n=1 Tax=Limosilactobacillus caecicola TaxID=2941332 RepID=UPI00203F37A7|nr:DUF4479 and tRNA-binding domain-containing protein [Limosilactobacillus caecicola]